MAQRQPNARCVGPSAGAPIGDSRGIAGVIDLREISRNVAAAEGCFSTG